MEILAAFSMWVVSFLDTLESCLMVSVISIRMMQKL